MPRTPAHSIILELFRHSVDVFSSVVSKLLALGVESAGVLLEPSVVDVYLAGSVYSVAVSPLSLVVVGDRVESIEVELVSAGVNPLKLARDSWLTTRSIPLRRAVALTQCLYERRECVIDETIRVEIAEGSLACEEIRVSEKLIAPFIDKARVIRVAKLPAGCLLACGEENTPVIVVSKTGGFTTIKLVPSVLEEIGLKPHLVSLLLLASL